MFEMSQLDVFGIPAWQPPTTHTTESQSSWVDPKTGKRCEGIKSVDVSVGTDGQPYQFTAAGFGQGEIERWEGDVAVGTFRTEDGHILKGKVTRMTNAYGGEAYEYELCETAGRKKVVASGRFRY